MCVVICIYTYIQMHASLCVCVHVATSRFPRGVDLKTKNEYWTQSSNMSSLDTRGELIRHKDRAIAIALWFSARG